MKRILAELAILSVLIVAGIPYIGFAGVPAGKAAPGAAMVTTTPSASKDVAFLPDCPVTNRFEGAVGIFAKNLQTGQTLILNPDDIFAAASTIKVPVSIVVYRHFYEQSDPAVRDMYDTGVELMMTVSDNDYFADFLEEIEEKIGSGTLREHFARLGMTHTMIRDDQAHKAFGYSNVTTARDMALIFEQLYRGNLINPEKAAFMLDGLSHSIFPDEMARYMQNRKVFHKIGELDDVLADVGIVEGPGGPVLISIFTETPRDGDYASDYIAAAAACVYTRLSGDRTAWNDPAAN